MKNIYLLGGTGSIGKQTIEVLRSFKNEYRLVSMSFNNNYEEAKKIIDEFNPQFVSCGTEAIYHLLKKEYPNLDLGYGKDGLLKTATYKTNNEGKDLVINSVVGMVGLTPTIEAIKLKRDILLANKETLVVGGEIITKYVKEYGVKLIPIDSEHSAILQCLQGRKKEEVKKLIITASGGAFRDYSRTALTNVTIDDALKHPNWRMGKKITVDCATMVNKGLEVIEAHFLFDIPYDKIETIIHKESVVHSMVEYNDNTIIAQMGKPDMRIPIQYALTYPNKCPFVLDDSLSFKKFHSLTFQEMDFERYPMLALAYKVGKAGGIMPAVFNASNEEAVKLFIEGKINFLDIEKIIFENVEKTNNIINPTLDQILSIDQQVRINIQKQFNERKNII